MYEKAILGFGAFINSWSVFFSRNLGPVPILKKKPKNGEASVKAKKVMQVCVCVCVCMTIVMYVCMYVRVYVCMNMIKSLKTCGFLYISAMDYSIQRHDSLETCTHAS